MNKEIEKMALRMVECIVRQSAIETEPEWPPQCTVILHQPRRPMKRNDDR